MKDLQCKNAFEREARKMLGLKSASGPNLYDLMYNEASFALTNSHPVFGDVFSVNPNSAAVAGYKNAVLNRLIKRYLISRL